MSFTAPLVDEEIVAPQLPLNPIQDVSQKPMSSNKRLYISLMKPGRLSYWLEINDSFVKSVIHYFGFAVSPILLGILYSTIRFEVITRYKYSNAFNADAWKNIFTPITVLVSIPVIIVFFRAIRTMFNLRSIPLHVLLIQVGRCLYFVGLSVTLILLYLIAVGFQMISDVIALLPLLVCWIVSIPLMVKRIQGLNAFTRRWHEHLQQEDHDRLLLWKAFMLKSQVIAEMVVFSLLFFFIVGVDIVCFHLTHPVSSGTLLMCASPLLLFGLSIICLLVVTAPILFSFLPPYSGYWRRQFGEVDLTASGKALEIAARMVIYLILNCLLLLSVFSTVAWYTALCKRSYDACAQMLFCAMVTSFVVGLLFFILLIIRIQIGTVTSDDTLHMIADREIGNREWREMQGQLPEHLIRSEADVYTILPSHVALAEETHTPRSTNEEKELCIICMAEYADTVLLPCGHGGCCNRCSKLLFQQVSKRNCPLCREHIQQVAKLRDHATRMYNNLPVYSVEKE